MARQPHTQVLCVTSESTGVVSITTSAGSATALYDAAVLLQPPIVNDVSPMVWSTTTNTTVVITGERCVVCASGFLLCWLSGAGEA